MLPEYEAIAFRRIIDQGAHTKPWLVEVMTPDQPSPFVVKVYTAAQNRERNSITAEVLGNIAARSFELNVPDAALINFSEDFRMMLNQECQGVLDLADDRIKFGTSYIDRNFQFIPGMSKYRFSKHVDIDTLYAYDNFIRNGDRGERKPNILLTKNDLYLIDHEMAFDIDENTIENFSKGLWEDKFGQYHIAWSYLKKGSKSTKYGYFETFLEYLRLFNTGRLFQYFKQLEHHGYDTKQEQILPYLDHIKENSGKFVNILRRFLS